MYLYHYINDTIPLLSLSILLKTFTASVSKFWIEHDRRDSLWELKLYLQFFCISFILISEPVARIERSIISIGAIVQHNTNTDGESFWLNWIIVPNGNRTTFSHFYSRSTDTHTCFISSTTLPGPHTLYAMDTLSYFQSTRNINSASIVIPSIGNNTSGMLTPSPMLL